MIAILIIIFVLSLFLIPLLVQLSAQYKIKIKDDKYYNECQKSLAKMPEKTEFDIALKKGYSAMMHIGSPYHKYEVELIKEGPLEYCKQIPCKCRWCVERNNKNEKDI